MFPILLLLASILPFSFTVHAQQNPTSPLWRAYNLPLLQDLWKTLPACAPAVLQSCLETSDPLTPENVKYLCLMRGFLGDLLASNLVAPGSGCGTLVFKDTVATNHDYEQQDNEYQDNEHDHENANQYNADHQNNQHQNNEYQDIDHQNIDHQNNEHKIKLHQNNEHETEHQDNEHNNENELNQNDYTEPNKVDLFGFLIHG
ncbi:hypothetical protein HDU98_011062 [Podochytrium sp. JEL0797]|nr:hypothetical protein HDU98_011062 [Podochytrium sp. JEL0797]